MLIFNLSLFVVIYFIFSLISVVFGKEFIVINEEFLIILSFLVVFFGLKQVLSTIVISELNARTLNLYNQFLLIVGHKESLQQFLINILTKNLNFIDLVSYFYFNFKKFLLYVIKLQQRLPVSLVNLQVAFILAMYNLKSNMELKRYYLSLGLKI